MLLDLLGSKELIFFQPRMDKFAKSGYMIDAKWRICLARMPQYECDVAECQTNCQSIQFSGGVAIVDIIL